MACCALEPQHATQCNSSSLFSPCSSVRDARWRGGTLQARPGCQSKPGTRRPKNCLAGARLRSPARPLCATSHCQRNSTRMKQRLRTQKRSRGLTVQLPDSLLLLRARGNRMLLFSYELRTTRSSSKRLVLFFLKLLHGIFELLHGVSRGVWRHCGSKPTSLCTIKTASVQSLLPEESVRNGFRSPAVSEVRTVAAAVCVCVRRVALQQSQAILNRQKSR